MQSPRLFGGGVDRGVLPPPDKPMGISKHYTLYRQKDTSRACNACITVVFTDSFIIKLSVYLLEYWSSSIKNPWISWEWSFHGMSEVIRPLLECKWENSDHFSKESLKSALFPIGFKDRSWNPRESAHTWRAYFGQCWDPSLPSFMRSAYTLLVSKWVSIFFPRTPFCIAPWLPARKFIFWSLSLRILLENWQIPPNYGTHPLNLAPCEGIGQTMFAGILM